MLGGFAEVSAQGLTVLADVAEAVEDIDRAVIADAHRRDWKSASPRLEPGSELDKLIARLDHFKAVDRHLDRHGDALNCAARCIQIAAFADLSTGITCANFANSFTTRS